MEKMKKRNYMKIADGENDKKKLDQNRQGKKRKRKRKITSKLRLVKKAKRRTIKIMKG
jgi:hypothetical protein